MYCGGEAFHWWCTVFLWRSIGAQYCGGEGPVLMTQRGTIGSGGGGVGRILPSLPLISYQLAHHHLIAVLLPWESTLAMILPTMTFIISSQGHDMTRATLDLGLSAYHTNDVIKSHPVQKTQNYLYCPVQIKPIYIYIYFSHKNKVLLSSIKWESESISTVALLSLLGFSLATPVSHRDSQFTFWSDKYVYITVAPMFQHSHVYLMIGEGYETSL